MWCDPEAGCDKKGESERDCTRKRSGPSAGDGGGRLFHFGPVSADQEMQTAGQPGEAITLSEALTLIWSKDAERLEKRNTYTWKMKSPVTRGMFKFQAAMLTPSNATRNWGRGQFNNRKGEI